MYTVVCDNCKKDMGDESEFSAWNNEIAAQDVAMEADWINDKGKDYCPDCISYDDNDELQIDSTRTKPT